MYFLMGIENEKSMSKLQVIEAESYTTANELYIATHDLEKGDYIIAFLGTNGNSSTSISKKILLKILLVLVTFPFYDNILNGQSLFIFGKSKKKEFYDTFGVKAYNLTEAKAIYRKNENDKNKSFKLITILDNSEICNFNKSNDLLRLIQLNNIPENNKFKEYYIFFKSFIITLILLLALIGLFSIINQIISNIK